MSKVEIKVLDTQAWRPDEDCVEGRRDIGNLLSLAEIHRYDEIKVRTEAGTLHATVSKTNRKIGKQDKFRLKVSVTQISEKALGNKQLANIEDSETFLVFKRHTAQHRKGEVSLVF